MIKLTLNQHGAVAALFSWSEETLIQSCLQGHHGSAWADDALRPACAQIVAGDFCLLAGDPAAREALPLSAHVPPGYTRSRLLILPENEAWCGLVETAWEGRFQRLERYAIKKEPGVFNRELLQSYARGLPEEYQIAAIDRELHDRLLTMPLFWGFVLNFDGSEDYLRRGIGFCAMHGERIIGGASSYTVYDGGIEIEIATDPEYRRQGVALACGARLILECLERQLYPSWDAANMGSARLAEKLGYHFSHAYPTYAVELKQEKREPLPMP